MSRKSTEPQQDISASQDEARPIKGSWAKRLVDAFKAKASDTNCAVSEEQRELMDSGRYDGLLVNQQYQSLICNARKRGEDSRVNYLESLLMNNYFDIDQGLLLTPNGEGFTGKLMQQEWIDGVVAQNHSKYIKYLEKQKQEDERFLQNRRPSESIRPTTSHGARGNEDGQSK